jgi:2-polyprenyl-3-methyl-5-hydroxy-6-metoxy-1,4-benzoquinol methylase
MTTNNDLQPIYDAGYAAGNTWHTPVDTWEESVLIHAMGGDWRNKSVLEIGCGEGRLAALIAMSGAYMVDAVDYSPSAIATAQSHHTLPRLNYIAGCLDDVDQHHDVIVMQGVLEHMDDWWLRLGEYISERLYPGGYIITSSPNTLNPRGYVWQTLRLLFGVPMSLTDLHAITPADMERFAAEHSCTLTYRSCHHDWAAGAMLQTDYAQRLPKALADAGMDASRVPELLAWLAETSRFYTPAEWSGATVVYKLEKRP